METSPSADDFILAIFMGSGGHSGPLLYEDDNFLPSPFSLSSTPSLQDIAKES